MGETGDLIMWQFIRAAGLLSYAMLSVSVFVGIALKCRFFDGLLKRPWVYEAHQAVMVAALGVMFIHLVLVMLDTHVAIGPVGVLIPLLSEWEPVPAALGTLAFYAVGALTVSTYAQRRIGYKVWRALHFGGYGAWWLALVHGLTAGSDTGLTGVQFLYWSSAGAVVFVTVFRVILPSPAKQPATRPAMTPQAVAS